MNAISAGMEEGVIALDVFLRKFTKALDLSGLVCYNDDRRVFAEGSTYGILH